MSYRLKGQKVIINGVEQIIEPSSLPETPFDGYFLIDEADGKFKCYNETKGAWIILGDAEDQSFDNSVNGFVSENTQDAIEEARNTPYSTSRFAVTTTFNSTVGNNQWLGYSELLPGNTTPIIIPRNCKLQEITFSWSSTITILLGLVTLSSDVDGTFNLYKNGTSSGDIIWSKVFSNASGGAVSSNINVSLNAGDFIIGRWVDQGSNPSDMAICYFFQPT